MADQGAGLELLLKRLNVADEATREFVRQELSMALAHDRRMDIHEMIQRYAAQAISFVLPGGGLD